MDLKNISQKEEALFYFDQSGSILQANGQAKYLFDLQKSDGKNYTFPEDLNEYNSQSLKKVINQKRKFEPFYIQLLLKNGTQNKIEGKVYKISLLNQQVYLAIFHETNFFSSLTTLLNLMKRMTTQRVDIEEVVDDVLYSIIELLNASFGLIHIVDYQKKYLKLAHSIGVSSKMLNPWKLLNLSEGLIGSIFDQKEIAYYFSCAKVGNSLQLAIHIHALSDLKNTESV